MYIYTYIYVCICLCKYFTKEGLQLHKVKYFQSVTNNEALDVMIVKREL